MPTALTKEGLWPLASPSLSSRWVWPPRLRAAFSETVYWSNNPRLDTERNCGKWRTLILQGAKGPKRCWRPQHPPPLGAASPCGAEFLGDPIHHEGISERGVHSDTPSELPTASHRLAITALWCLGVLLTTPPGSLFPPRAPSPLILQSHHRSSHLLNVASWSSI